MDLSSHNHLVGTEWLKQNLEVESLRVVESTSLLPNYFEDNKKNMIERVSGRQMWEQDHIPGSIFVDILTELSDDKNGRFMYGMPSAQQFSSVMSEKGIDNSNGIVIYDRNTNMWAARFWWMLRAFGFENAVVLDGGYSKWTAENKKTDNLKSEYTPTQFKVQPKPELIADRDKVLEVIEKKSDACLINALDPAEFEGRPPHRYKRAGRIPGSRNVPFTETVNIENQLYIDEKQASGLFKEAGALSAKEVICYCGGGIAACSTALLLTRLGHEKVSVYDGSMKEWSADTNLPIEAGKN